MRPLVVLHRDGTIIEERPYLSDPEGVRLLPGAAEGLRLLQREGFSLAVATNQSGVGRGYFGLEEVAGVNQRLREVLGARGVLLKKVYCCPHHPEARCYCRKPEMGLLQRAAREAGASFQDTFVVGDKECDIEMGRRAGARTILVRTGWGRAAEKTDDLRPDFVAEDLREAASIIVRRARVLEAAE